MRADGVDRMLGIARAPFVHSWWHSNFLAASVVWSMFAVETALKERLGKPKWSLEELIEAAQEDGILDWASAEVLGKGRRLRNDLVHGKDQQRSPQGESPRSSRRRTSSSPASSSGPVLRLKVDPRIRLVSPYVTAGSSGWGARLRTVLGAAPNKLRVEDLDSVVRDGVREDEDLDFKEELYGNSDGDRAELATSTVGYGTDR